MFLKESVHWVLPGTQLSFIFWKLQMELLSKTKQDYTYSLFPNGGTAHSRRWYIVNDQTGWMMPYMTRDDLIKEWFNSNTMIKSSISASFFTYQSWSVTERRKWRKAQEKTPEYQRRLAEYEQPMVEETMSDFYDDDLDDCDCEICKPNPYKKGNTMNYAAAVNTSPLPTDQKQREYLLDRLTDIQIEKSSDLHKFFRLDPVKSPRSFNEFIEKVKSGDVSFNGKDKDEKYYSLYTLLSFVRWAKDPEDRDGYNAATKKMDEAVAKTKDIIVIKSPEDGLKALEAFEAQTFH